jgi:hypothetical protein
VAESKLKRPREYSKTATRDTTFIRRKPCQNEKSQTKEDRPLRSNHFREGVVEICCVETQPRRERPNCEETASTPK